MIEAGGEVGKLNLLAVGHGAPSVFGKAAFGRGASPRRPVNALPD